MIEWFLIRELRWKGEQNIRCRRRGRRTRSRRAHWTARSSRAWRAWRRAPASRPPRPSRSTTRWPAAPPASGTAATRAGSCTAGSWRTTCAGCLQHYRLSASTVQTVHQWVSFTHLISTHDCMKLWHQWKCVLRGAPTKKSARSQSCSTSSLLTWPGACAPSTSVSTPRLRHASTRRSAGNRIAEADEITSAVTKSTVDEARSLNHCTLKSAYCTRTLVHGILYAVYRVCTIWVWALRVLPVYLLVRVRLVNYYYNLYLGKTCSNCKVNEIAYSFLKRTPIKKN